MKIIILKILSQTTDLLKTDHSAVLLNNQILSTSATPGEDLVLNELANNLSKALSLNIDTIQFKDVDSLPNNWHWNDVKNELVAQGVLSDNIALGSTTLLNTTIQDIELYTSDLLLPNSKKAKYNLTIEQSNDLGTIYFSVVNENVVQNKDGLQLGIHGSIEIRSGLPALSVGVSPDDNIIHISTNTSTKLAVTKDCNRDKPTWEELDYKAGYGLVFTTPYQEELNEVRLDIANRAITNVDFNGCTYDSEINDNNWDIDKQSNLLTKIVKVVDTKIKGGVASLYRVNAQFYGEHFHYRMNHSKI